MPQILWIGCLESDEEFKVKAKKGYDLASAQVSQKNLLYGIEDVSNIICDSINGSVLPPYPVYKDRIVQSVEWEHKQGAKDISVGYKNDKYINRLNCKNSMLKAADKWIETRYKGGELITFVYSMRSAPMATACHIKERIPQAKLYLIVTDLPQFMDLGQSIIKAALKKIDWISIKKMQKKFDGFILYAEKMAEYLAIPDGKWMLMEGSYDISEQITVPKEQKKAIMYSGKLDEKYGIKILIDSFMEIYDNDIELWITGGGDSVKYIKECANEDKRIKFYGFLPNREDVIKKQLQATALINMRLPSEKASEYCFPSKLFEYMATGIPVLSFKIKGIPREYNDYLWFIESEDKKSIKKTLYNIFNSSKYTIDAKGNEAKKFIIEKKSTISQCKRIWEYVNEKK